MGQMNDGGKRETFETGAVREPSTGKGAYELISPFALMRIAKWYEGGAKKYSDRNWEKGLKFGRLIQSALRHLIRWMMGDRSEDHLAAVCWNIMAMIHFEELGMDRELNDYPDYSHLLREKEDYNETPVPPDIEPRKSLLVLFDKVRLMDQGAEFWLEHNPHTKGNFEDGVFYLDGNVLYRNERINCGDPYCWRVDDVNAPMFRLWAFTRQPTEEERLAEGPFPPITMDYK